MLLSATPSTSIASSTSGPWALALSALTLLGVVLSTPVGQTILARIIPKKPSVKPTNYEVALLNNELISKLLDEDFLKLAGIRKAVIVESKNGGGIPTPGSPLFSSIVLPYKWSSTWWNQLLDREYSKFILHLLQKQYVEINIEELDHNGLLYPLFKEQGISYCEAYAMKKTNERFYFLAIDYYVDREHISDHVDNEVRRLVNHVRTLINE